MGGPLQGAAPAPEPQRLPACLGVHWPGGLAWGRRLPACLPACDLSDPCQLPYGPFPPSSPRAPAAQVLVFVNSPDAGLRARLFLEAFGVRAAALSADLPLNSRHHILQARKTPGGRVP